MSEIGTNGEALILGAAGYSRTDSPWMVYQILQGRQRQQAQDDGAMTRTIRSALLEHLRESYGTTTIEDPFCTSFTRDFEIAPFLRIKSPGSLSCGEGDVLMLEIVDRKTLDFVWKVNYDVVLPYHVRAKANIRMRACAARNTLVWLVCDMGEIDEFHQVDYDPRLVERLEASCNFMMKRVLEDDEPDPSDEDLNAAITFAGGDGNETRKLGADDPLVKVLADYQDATQASSAAYKQQKAAEDTAKALKNELLRALRSSPRIVFPDGRALEAKTTKVKAQQREPYQFQKLCVTEPRAASAE